MRVTRPPKPDAEQPAAPVRRTHPSTAGDREYSDEERIWMAAVEAYKKRHRIRFMQLCDFLAVAHELGYRKVG